MAKAVSVIEATLNLDGSQWENAIKRASDAADSFVTDTRALMAGLGSALLGISATLGAAAVGLKVMGDQALTLRKNLSGAFSGSELDQVADTIAEISSLQLPNIGTEDLVEGAKKIGVFSDQVAKDLERVGDLAARTGESFGSLQEYVAQFTINPSAQEELKEIANITPQRLADFGAVLDSTGEKILVTGENAKIAREALRGVLDTDFAGAMNQMASGTDKLRSELQLLAQDAGTAIAVFADDTAGFLAPFVEGLREFLGTAAPTIGIVTALGAAVAGLGAAAIGVTLAASAFASIGGSVGALFIVEQLVMKIGIISLPALAKSAAAAAASWALLLGLGAGIVLLFHKTTQAINDQTAAQEQLLQIEIQRAQWAKTAGDLQGKTTDELREQGKTAADAARAILGLQDRIEAARKAGNEGLAESLERQVTDLQRTKRELAELETAQRDKEKAEDPGGFNKPSANLDDEKQRITFLRAQGKITEKEALDLQAEALEHFKADQSERRALLIETAQFETNERAKLDEDHKKSGEEGFKVELDRIKLLQTQRKISQEQAFNLEEKALDTFERSEAEKRALIQRRAEQASGDEKKYADKVEKARSDQVQDRLEQIQLLRTEEKISAAQQIKAYDDVLARYALTEDEKVKIRQKRADVEKSIRDKEAAEDKKAADDKLKLEQKNAADLAKARDEGRDLLSDDLESKQDGLKERSGLTGRGNAGELQKIIEEQRASAESQILAERDKLKAATDSADARVQIEANAQEQLRQLQAETAKQLAEALGDQADAVGKYADSLKKETAVTGKDNSSKMKQALQEQLNLEAEVIRAEGERAKAGAANAQERADIETRTQQHIRAEQLETAESYQQYLDDMLKAEEDAKRKKRGESSFQGVFGIEDLNASIQSTLSQSSVRSREPSLASFTALPSFVSPRRADDFSPAASIGSDVGAAVASAMKRAQQEVLVRTQTEVTVSDERATARSKTTEVDGRMSEYEKAGRGLAGPARAR